MRRVHVALVLALALPALAGCVGSDLLPADEPGPATPGPGTPDPPPERVLATTSTAWSAGPTGDAFSLEIEVGSGADAVFPEVRYDLGPPSGTVAVEAVAPDGTRYDVTAEEGTTDGEDWEHAILPPQEGTWTIEGTASGDAAGLLRASAVADGPDPAPQETAGDGRVVIAIVDTGVNPYHEAFEAPDLETRDLPARIEDTDRDAPPLSAPLLEGTSYPSTLRRDAGLWADLPDRRLVHFQGTRVLGYDLGAGGPATAPVLDTSGHGTMTSHAAARQNPDALVVMVTGGDYDAGVEWATRQPWIDLVSLSWGPVVNAAGVAEPHAFDFTTAEATHEAWEAGKLVFSATGNDPTHALTDTTSGPPWVHSVSGSQPHTKGRAFMSGNGVDTVANWTQTLADHESLEGNLTASGTSFATPLTAGVASRILTEVRAETGHEGGVQDGAFVDADGVTVTNGDLREALNRTAVYWNATDYGGPTEPGPSVPVAPAAPWLSMGWGHVDGRVVDPAVRGLLGLEDLPDKPDGAEAYMEANHDARQTYWETR